MRLGLLSGSGGTGGTWGTSTEGAGHEAAEKTMLFEGGRVTAAGKTGRMPVRVVGFDRNLPVEKLFAPGPQDRPESGDLWRADIGGRAGGSTQCYVGVVL